jgi:hypothetical protein
VQGPRFRILAIAADRDDAGVNLQGSAARNLHVELALGAFDENLRAFDIHLHLGGNGDGLFSNS